MQIWVDADACPVEAKQILFKVSRRTQIPLTLVANQMMSVPRSKLFRFELVPAGANRADQRIVELLSAGDIVISADVPLAAEAIERGAVVIDPRGNVLTDENIGGRLAARNLMDDLRGSGLETGGPAAYSARDRQSFANQIDRMITRLSRAR